MKLWKVRSLERIHSAYNVLQFLLYRFLKLSDTTVLCGQFLQSFHPLSFVNHRCLWQWHAAISMHWQMSSADTLLLLCWWRFTVQSKQQKERQAQFTCIRKQICFCHEQRSTCTARGGTWRAEEVTNPSLPLTSAQSLLELRFWLGLPGGKCPPRYKVPKVACLGATLTAVGTKEEMASTSDSSDHGPAAGCTSGQSLATLTSAQLQPNPMPSLTTPFPSHTHAPSPVLMPACLQHVCPEQKHSCCLGSIPAGFGPTHSRPLLHLRACWTRSASPRLCQCCQGTQPDAGWLPRDTGRRAEPAQVWLLTVSLSWGEWPPLRSGSRGCQAKLVCSLSQGFSVLSLHVFSHIFP